MATLDPVAVIAALKQEVDVETAAVKASLVLIEQLVAEIVDLKAKLAASEAQLQAVSDATTAITANSQSLDAEVAKYSASGQPNV